MKFPRSSGILLHPTSLAGEFGIGDLGPAAFRFVDFLAKAGQTWWQMLPLVATGYGNSPYSAYSTFAGNTLLVSPEKLVEDEFLEQTVIDNRPQFPPDRVDYGTVIEWKRWLIDRAFESFAPGDEYDRFVRENAFWLDDYALFRALREAHGHKTWDSWPDKLKYREPNALVDTAKEHEAAVTREKFAQFVFYKQLSELKTHANGRGVYLIGDIPIFVSHDSADVWCNQEIFKLNDDGSPKFVSGTPPDYFSTTGQKWGNPLFDWDAMAKTNFDWWTARVAWALKWADVARLDHFIGFVRTWEIPAEDDTAENGQWIDVPGRELFATLKERLGDVALIAEDLGSMTPEVEKLRDDLELPGMRILQYGFGGDSNNRDLPHNYVRNCVAYTGTHDNDTTAGWWRTAPKNVREHCRKYLNTLSRNICGEMVRALFASVADIAILPLQDVLGLGSETRINTPGTSGGNWEWRVDETELTDEVATRLSDLTGLYGRKP